MQRGRWLGLLVVLSGYLLPTPAHASGQLVSNLQISAQLQRDGHVRISQQLSMADPSPLDWQLFTNAQNLEVDADSTQLSHGQYSLRKVDNHYTVQSAQLANVWRLTYLTTTTLIRHDSRDQFFLRIFEEPGAPIESTQVVFQLPATSMKSDLTGNAYAISGVTDSNTYIDQSKTTVIYTASYSGPAALLTISASWSKQVLQLTKLQEWRLSLSDLEILPWLLLGLFLPLISLTVLLILIYRAKASDSHNQGIYEQPPAQLSPILVGVLVHKKIYPEVVVSMLVDLCLRGYLVIVKKGGEYYLSQRKPVDAQLTTWERMILEQIFAVQHRRISTDSLAEATNASLFSPKVRQAFSDIYQAITDLRYFAENPHFTRMKYKLAALLLYFTSAISIVWTVATGSSPYLLLPLAATIIIALLIIRLSPYLIHYTSQGQVARDQWQGFANYLKLDRPIPSDAARNQLFERYLPYAISLNSTTEWSGRFDRSSLTALRPDWFVTYEEKTTSELARELVAFTKQISTAITNLRGPLVN